MDELHDLSEHRRKYDWRRKNEELTLFRSDIYLACPRRGVRETEELYELMGEAWKTILHEAQKKVYDLQYPHRRRAWGPFLLVPSDGRSSEDDESSAESEDRAEMLPHPEHLRPDWEQLAAIRIAVQSRMILNLESVDIFNRGVDAVSLEAASFQLLSWENLRAGVWTQMPWVAEKDAESKGGVGQQGSRSSGRSPGIAKSPTEPTVEWDWAGAGGVWRYVLEQLLDQARER